jgi:Polyphosphate kinase 2 (PPK2)
VSMNLVIATKGGLVWPGPGLWEPDGAFKQPSAEELDHDFLWRYPCSLPGRGRIGIFNRSHYEEVLVVRVHPELLAAERMPNAGERSESDAAGRSTTGNGTWPTTAFTSSRSC